MRLILFLFIIVYPAIQCQDNNIQNNDLDVILQFIDEKMVQKKIDIRIYDPPPPPELKDSINHSGRIRPDSIIKKLKPLTVYINDSIWFDPNFKPKTEGPGDFSFIKNVSTSSMVPIGLDISSLPKRNGIVLQSIHLSEFKKIFPSIRYETGYGGIASFQNLFFSEDGKKAYFEIHLYKDKLSAGTKAIYAKWKNGKWKYIEHTLSVS